MKRLKDLRPARINVLCFCGALALLGVLAVVVPKPTFSPVEKRALAARPSLTAETLFSSRFSSGFTAFFADTFPGRDRWIGLARRVDELRGIRPDSMRMYGAAAQPAAQDPAPQQSAVQPAQSSAASGASGTAPQSSAAAQSSQASSAAAAADDADAEGYLTKNGIFVVRDRAVNLFGGNKAIGRTYAQTVNSYLDAVGPSVRVYDMIVPCSAEFYLPQRYKTARGDQKANIDYIYSQLDSRVTAVDAYSQLAARQNEYIYFRTDHHWTALGAYCAYTAFCRSAGFEPVPLEQMQAKTLENFRGSFYAQTGDPILKANPDTLTYYIPSASYESWVRVKNQPGGLNKMNSLWDTTATGTNSYCVFLRGDYPMEKIVTGSKTGRRIAVVKESYGNAFVPFLLSHYDEIYVVDLRYFQTSLVKLVLDAGVTDLLFLNNIFAANTPYHINHISNMKNQTWSQPAQTSSNGAEEITSGKPEDRNE